MPPLLRDLLRPRRRTLAAIAAAMLVQMVMSIAAPWPLKIIIDKVIGTHRQFHWIDSILGAMGTDNKMRIAEAAGIATVLIAVVAGAAMYVASYFTETLSQSIGTICACGFTNSSNSFRLPITTPPGSAPSFPPYHRRADYPELCVGVHAQHSSPTP